LPGATEEAAETKRRLTPDPGLEMLAGVKLTVIPAGKPPAVSVTGALKVLLAATVTCIEPPVPFKMLTCAGDAASVKLGAGRTTTASGIDFV
jgi:hypothetical protein